MAPTPYADVLARNIRAARSRVGLSQQSVAARMRALGFGEWVHQTVGKVERVRRRVTAEETLGLALCLDTTVQRLMTPLWEDKWVDLPSGASLRVGAVVTLVTGELPANDSIPTSQEFLWHNNKLVRSIIPPHEVQGVRWTAPQEELPVVAGIVTSRRGVLIGRRNDGKPPWTFIAGESEPGEEPTDTIIRELKEEAGIDVRPREIIGARRHPRTGRHMIYIAARPVRSLKVINGDPSEMAEVKWASLGDLAELLPDMFEPVREYLADVLGEQEG